MLQKVLERVRTECAKHVFSAREDIVWEDFSALSRKSIEIFPQPFPHIVVDDFLKEWAYEDLLRYFRSVQSLGYARDTKVLRKFHAFEIDYDGYVFVPPPTLDPKNALSLFYSLEWNLFFSRLFSQHTTFETSLALHHHPPEDRTGFVHHDFADKRFLANARLQNGVIPFSVADTDTEKSYERKRIIALIFFLGNDAWKEGDGGEVGLYSSDKTTLIKKIEPKNNRLFAFQISPHSFHAFQENHSDRNSIIQWFHVPNELL